MADKRGNRFVMTLGMALVAGSLVASALVLSFNPWILSAVLLFTYVGFSFLQTGLINSVSQTLPMQETGVGMGLFNLVGILAGAIGTAGVAKLLETGWLGFDAILGIFALGVILAGGWYILGLKPKFVILSRIGEK